MKKTTLDDRLALIRKLNDQELKSTLERYWIILRTFKTVVDREHARIKMAFQELSEEDVHDMRVPARFDNQIQALLTAQENLYHALMERRELEHKLEYLLRTPEDDETDGHEIG